MAVQHEVDDHAPGVAVADRVVAPVRLAGGIGNHQHQVLAGPVVEALQAVDGEDQAAHVRGDVVRLGEGQPPFGQRRAGEEGAAAFGFRRFLKWHVDISRLF